MTKEEQDKLNELMQYAQLGGMTPLPQTAGWGTFPYQGTAIATTSSMASVAIESPEIES